MARMKRTDNHLIREVYELILMNKTTSEIVKLKFNDMSRSSAYRRIRYIKVKLMENALGLPKKEYKELVDMLYRYDMNFNARDCAKKERLFADEDAKDIAISLMNGVNKRIVFDTVQIKYPKLTRPTITQAVLAIRYGQTYRDITFKIPGYEDFCKNEKVNRTRFRERIVDVSNDDLRIIYNMVYEGKNYTDIVAVFPQLSYGYMRAIVADIKSGTFGTIIRHALSAEEIKAGVVGTGSKKNFVCSRFSKTCVKGEATNSESTLTYRNRIVEMINMNYSLADIAKFMNKDILHSASEYNSLRVYLYEHIKDNPSIDPVAYRALVPGISGTKRPHEKEEIRRKYFSGESLEDIARWHRLYPVSKIEKIIFDGRKEAESYDSASYFL